MNSEYFGTTIYRTIKDIEEGKMFLPAIQRKFVWDEERITLLFDSIMKRYPIGTFLFWYLDKKIADDYVFYRFLHQYDERDPYNKKKTGSFTKDTIIGVLDGQQRLSSIFIGLQGTYTTKTKYMRHNNPDAWPERKLYLNLLNLPYTKQGDYNISINEELDFEFKFIEPKKVKNSVKKTDDGTKGEYWLPVGDVLKWPEDPVWPLIHKKIVDSAKSDSVKEMLVEKQDSVYKCIGDLHSRFRTTNVINYFKTEKQELESILNIFVRVNSGAVILSKSDLLFSTIVATWEDGRKEIEELQKKINEQIGEGFDFSNDFIMRSLLVLSDLPVVYNVKSFKSDNVKNIRHKWEDLSNAIVKSVQLLANNGFNGSLIPSQNAVIPIAYYIYKGGNLTESAKADLIKYLKHAFLKGTFGGQGDAVLASIRKALTRPVEDENSKSLLLKSREFNFSNFLSDLQLPGSKSLKVTEEDIDEFLESKKGTYTYILLSMIYPDFKYGQITLHQDHIHPYSIFKQSTYDQFKLTDAERMLWEERKNMLPNLQLIEGGENQSKNDKPFLDWLKQTYEDNEPAKNHFLERNFIPKDTSLDFQNFEVFFKKREEILRDQLREILKVK